MYTKARHLNYQSSWKVKSAIVFLVGEEPIWLEVSVNIYLLLSGGICVSEEFEEGAKAFDGDRLFNKLLHTLPVDKELSLGTQ